MEKENNNIIQFEFQVFALIDRKIFEIILTDYAIIYIYIYILACFFVQRSVGLLLEKSNKRNEKSLEFFECFSLNFEFQYQIKILKIEVHSIEDTHTHTTDKDQC